MNNIFGQIIRGEIPADKVFENEKVIAFKDIHPQAPVHILIVPKVEIAQLQDMQPADYHYLAEVVQAIQHLAEKYKLRDGYRVIVNNGPGAGQTVPQLHFHLLGGTHFAEHSLADDTDAR